MRTKAFFLISIVSFGLTTSCSDFISLDSPVTQVSRQQVFADDTGVKAAISGIFSQMINSGAFASGSLASMTIVGGLASDELTNYQVAPDYVALAANNLAPVSNIVSSNWNEMYLYIYEANSIIEGIENGGSMITPKVRKESLAEAKFIRAFCYFYLVNLFGDVPLILTTDYRVNRLASRTPAVQVYDQIVADLTVAKNDLPLDYSISDGQRTQPNSFAAAALLARTYLYQGKWAEAEGMADQVIANTAYSLPALNSVFLSNSAESIWQIRPSNPALNTNEAPVLIVISASPTVSLSSQAASFFSPADQRRAAWTRTFTGSGKTFEYAFKYKVRLRNQPITEYYVVLRLAEQYLIRAEARIRQGKIDQGIADLNRLRTRASAATINAAGVAAGQALLYVEDERRLELFAEWGHRWFDLKRTGRAEAVLGPLKSGFSASDLLFPIPQNELNTNPNLTQNP